MQLTDLLTGTPDEVLERTLALPQPQRRALVTELKASLSSSSEIIERQQDHYGARDPEAFRLASVALLAAITPSDPVLSKLGFEAHQLKRVLLDRAPSERATMAARLVGRQTSWSVVRELVRAGDLEPVRSAEYFATWFSWAYCERGTPLADRLRAEPEALSEVWELLATEDTGDRSFTTFDTYVEEPGKWTTALVELCRTGELDRARLLDLTLDVLSRDFTPHRAQWYSKLHEALAPTPEERAAAQHRYARLCGSGSPRTVQFAVRALSAVQKAGTLDAEVALQHLPAAAAGRAVGTAKLTVRLAIGIVAEHPELAGAAREVFETALTHEASDIRELAGAQLDLPEPESAAVELADYPEPVPLPFAERRMLVTPLEIPDSPGALAEALSALLVDARQADLLLAALDGAHRLAGHLDGALKPLVPRATKVVNSYTEAAHKLVATLILGLAGREVSRPKTGIGWLLPLHHRVTALLDGTAVPVSAATHHGGWLDPVVFVTRMLEHPDAPEIDVVDALLRLAPDTRAEALELAAKLTGPHADAVRFALGGPQAPEQNWIGLAAARARHPESADPVAALKGDPGPPLTWSVHVDPSKNDWECMEFTDSPEPSVPDVPWLGLLANPPSSAEWEGFTLPHVSVSSPYDRGWVEADVALDLFVNDVEVSYPTEQVGLPPYLDRPSVPERTGVMIIATALAAKRPTAAPLGMDVALSLLDQRLLGPRALGDALAVLGSYLVPTRLVKRLAVVANEHPVAMLSTLDTLLPQLDRSLRGVFALLELAADLKERGAGELSPATRQWLAGFTGSSKAAKAASRLAR